MYCIVFGLEVTQWCFLCVLTASGKEKSAPQKIDIHLLAVYILTSSMRHFPSALSIYHMHWKSTRFIVAIPMSYMNYLSIII